LKILKEYEKVFYGHSIPFTLQALAQFEEEVGTETYAESFWLQTNRDIFMYWLHDSTKEEIEEYSSHVFPFANADGTGGFYAFWVKDASVDLEKAPIVCYGSEGAVKIVAKNLKDLIKILSYGPEGMDGNYAFCEEESIETFTEYYPNFMPFRQWMKESLSIEPIKNWKVLESKEVDEIIAEANRLYKEEFDAWQYQFYASSEEIYEEAIKIAPTKENYAELIDLYFKEESYENAIVCLRGLFAVGSVEEYNYSFWGGDFFDAGYNEYALEVFEEGIKKIDDYDDKADLCRSIAEVYEQIGNKEKEKEYQNLSINFYKQALGLKEYEIYKARILQDIANIYDSQGESQLYIDYMQEALQLTKNDEKKSEILYNIAETYDEMNLPEKAIEYAKKSYLLDEDEEVAFFIEQQESLLTISDAKETLRELKVSKDKRLEMLKPQLKKGFIQTLLVLLLAIVVYYIWGATWFFWLIFIYFFISVSSIALIKMMIMKKEKRDKNV
jgi:tetratricopeptide (TPR) repeat protein